MHAILDGDVVAYRACFIGAGDGMLEDEVCDVARSLTLEWAEEAGCVDRDKIIMCLSPKTTFRHSMAESYKAHRKARAKPSWLAEVRSFLAEEFTSRTDPNIEADDTMGILQSSMEEPTVIVTVDKDLLQIPGLLYNPVKKKWHVSTPDTGWNLFLTQWLTGDSVDGYPGIRGIGPKKAALILEDSDDPVKTIVDLYEEKGYSWEFCRDQARMAMILDNTRWDSDAQLPLLYEPPHVY